jgi:lipoate-protein ligase A
MIKNILILPQSANSYIAINLIADRLQAINHSEHVLLRFYIHEPAIVLGKAINRNFTQ